MANYLLDTNCFYFISESQNKENKIIRLLKKIEKQLFICPISVVEICNLSEKRKSEYHKRKRAINVLIEIKSEIYQDTPDDMVSFAFNGEGYQKESKIDWQICIDTLTKSNSFENAVSGVLDYDKRRTLKFNVDLVAEWKKQAANFFSDSIAEGNSDVRKKCRELVTARESEELNKTRVRELNKELTNKVSKIENTYDFILSALYSRAGFCEEEEYFRITQGDDLEELDKLIARARAAYKGSLETYIKIYAEYRRECLLEGYNPEKNDVFDLDFFSYVDSIEDCIFVTNEPKWITYSDRLSINKVISLPQLLDKIK